MFHYFCLDCHYFCVFLTTWHYGFLCFQSPLWSLLIRLPVCKVVSFCVCSSRLKKYGIRYSFLEVVLCKTPFELREHIWKYWFNSVQHTLNEVSPLKAQLSFQTKEYSWGELNLLNGIATSVEKGNAHVAGMLHTNYKQKICLWRKENLFKECCIHGLNTEKYSLFKWDTVPFKD
jgi:hypothetical protein